MWFVACVCALTWVSWASAPLAAPHAAAPPGSQPARPPARIQLEDAKALALGRNPGLAAIDWERRALEAAVEQAGAGLNPELEIEIENFAGGGDVTGLGGAETTVSLSQTLELGGKRDRRRELAAAERALGDREFERSRLEVAAEVTRRFVAVLEAQEQVQLADTLIAITEAMLQSVTRRAAAGALSPVDVSRARIELATIRIDRVRSARELEIARTWLASSWGDSVATFELAVGDLEQLPGLPDRQALRAGVDSGPDVAFWTSEIGARDAATALERARGIPDLSVRGGWRRLGEAETSAFLVGIGLPLPFRDRNRASIRAAEHHALAGAERRHAARTRALAALAAIHEELLATADEATTLRLRVLPEAIATARTARDAHARGLLTLTDVFDTQRQLFELRGRYIATLAAHHTRIADLELLTGTTLAELVAVDREDD